MTQKNDITRAAIWAVLRDYFAQYQTSPWTTLVSALAPSVGSILIFLVPPLIVSEIVNIFSAGGARTVGDLSWYIGLFALTWFVGEMCWRLAFHMIIRLESRGIADLSKRSFQELVHRDYHFFTNHFVGSLTKQTTAYARNFEKFTDTMIFSVCNNLIPAIFACVILWQYSPFIPLILIRCFTVVVTIAIPIIRRRMVLIAARHEAQSRVSGMLSDTVTNILAVKSCAQEKAENATFAHCIDDAMAKWKRAADYQNLRFDMTMSPLAVLTNLFGLVAAIFFVYGLELSPGTLVVIFSYYASVTRIFWEVNRVYRDVETAITEAAEFTQIMLAPPAIEDRPDATTLVVKNASIDFQQVNFSYWSRSSSRLPSNEDTSKQSSSGEPIMFLKDFSLNIPKNQKVWLVGPSGGGKTTITKLLLRFLDLQWGQITIDGQDIAAVTQTSLRDAISYVPQEPLLFHRSLRDNIAYGRPDATDEAVLNASRLAHAHEFISELPHGYDTMVGERGIKLSGGQRQRIAIARAILKSAPILILDEATSALDSESEKYIQAWLNELMQDKTALVIAHRLSTIRHLDRILVLAEGKIVQDGTHDELKNQPGLYATLWWHQSGEFLVN